MSHKKILGHYASQSALTDTAPSGDVGIDMTAYTGQMKADFWKICVTGADAHTVTLWVRSPTSNLWGRFNDVRGVIVAGVLCSARPAGTDHFIVQGLGVFDRVYFQTATGNGDVDVVLSEIHAQGRN